MRGEIADEPHPLASLPIEDATGELQLARVPVDPDGVQDLDPRAEGEPPNRLQTSSPAAAMFALNARPGQRSSASARRWTVSRRVLATARRTCWMVRA